jgi:hypothetical protein
MAITLCAFVSLGLYGPAQQTDQRIVDCKVAIAETFSVSFGNQERFGNLTRTPDDEPLLFFADLKTGRSLQMCLFKGRSPAVALENNDHRLSLSAPFSGTSSIQLSNSIRRSALDINVDPGNAPYLTLTDRTGKKISFAAGSNGNPSIISLFDKTETSRIRLVGSPEATLLSLLDKDGKVRMLGGLTPGKSAQLMLYDFMRQPSVEVTLGANDVPLLRLRDPHRRISNTFK